MCQAFSTPDINKYVPQIFFRTIEAGTEPRFKLREGQSSLFKDFKKLKY